MMTLQQAKDFLEEVKQDPKKGFDNPEKLKLALSIVASEWAKK